MHQGGDHISENKKKIIGGKMRKKSRLCPQLSGYHKGGFQTHPERNKKLNTQRICLEWFSILLGVREKEKKKFTHRERIPDTRDHTFSKNDVYCDDWHAVFVFY